MLAINSERTGGLLPPVTMPVLFQCIELVAHPETAAVTAGRGRLEEVMYEQWLRVRPY